MQRNKLLAVGSAAVLCAGLMLGQTRAPVDTFERGLRPHPQDQAKYIAGVPARLAMGLEIRLFHLNNVRYRATLSEEALLASPDWTPAKPLPLDFARAESIARQQLRKLVADDTPWEVKGFNLRSAEAGMYDADGLRVPGKSTVKWYLQVELRSSSGQQPGSFWVFMNLAGQTGKVEPQP